MIYTAPERSMDSRKIDDQHRQIMDLVNRLLAEATGSSGASMATQFGDLCAAVAAHFKDEEDFLAAQGSAMLTIQQREHGVLTRMLTNMAALMNSSEQLQWRATVIGEAIDALALHFAKEDGLFRPLVGRRHAKSLQSKTI